MRNSQGWNILPQCGKPDAHGRDWLVPVALLVASVAAYGPLASRMGFHWEDWLFVGTHGLAGVQGLRDLLANERPIASVIYSFTIPLIGTKPVYYHVLSALLHGFAAIAVWVLVRLLWANEQRLAALSAILFAVYPGYSLQPISIQNSHLFLQYNLCLWSLVLMVLAMRRKTGAWLAIGIAVLAMSCSLLFNEYFLGLEMARPFVAWIVLKDDNLNVRARLIGTLKASAPFLLVVGIYGYWRVKIFTPWMYDAKELGRDLWQNPIGEIGRRIMYAISDIYEAGILAWENAVSLEVIRIDYPHNVILVATCLFCVGVYLFLRTTGKNTKDCRMADGVSHKGPVYFGLVCMIAGGLPIWFADKEVNLWGLSNRLIVPFMFGAAVLAGGMIMIMFRTWKQRMLVVSVLTSLAMGYHMRNGVVFMYDWREQQQLAWQLAWRVPELERGTAVFAVEKPSRYMNDYLLAMQLNMMYGSRARGNGEVEYWVFVLTWRDREGHVRNVQLGRDVRELHGQVSLDRVYRNIRFSGNTAKSLSYWYSRGRCLRVIDAERGNIEDLPRVAIAAGAISNVDLIRGNSLDMRWMTQVYGAEPEQSWCYYYQKAELARQRKEWNEVARLGDEARRLGHTTTYPAEWGPFLDAYERVGRVEDAQKVRKSACKGMVHERPRFCGNA